MDFLSSVGRRESVTVNETGRWVELGNKSLNGYERNVLYKNLGVRTSESDPRELPWFADTAFLDGADLIEDGRAAVFLDIEGDGDLDLAVQNFGRPVSILEQRGTPAERVDEHWLQVQLRSDSKNTDALGARVLVDLADGSRSIREVQPSAGYLAGQSRVLHFGLGAHERAERIEIVWPTGPRTVLNRIPADRRITVEETIAVGAPSR